MDVLGGISKRGKFIGDVCFWPFCGDPSFGKLPLDLCPYPGIARARSFDTLRRKRAQAYALRSGDPVLLLEHRELLAAKGPVPEEDYEIPFGKARITREGTDATVVGISRMVHLAVEAADQLSAEGVSVEIIDPRTVSPLDTDTILRSVAKTGRLLIVDEGFQPCSVASEIVAHVADEGFDDLDAPIRRLNGAFTPTPYTPTLEQAVVPQVEDVVQAIRDLMLE